MVNNTTAERLLTAKAVGDILSLSKRQVFRMRSAGLICPPVKVGAGALRFRQSDILLWISLGCCSQKEFVARKQAEQKDH